MTGRIFISYRRGDAEGYVRALFLLLEREFGEKNVIIDIENRISPGANFVDVIDSQISAADIVVVVIGPRWLELLNSRINETDFVRHEIIEALQTRKRIVPVLVDGAQIPTQAELPSQLSALSKLLAASVRPPSFNEDSRQLIAALTSALTSDASSARAVEHSERHASPVRSAADEDRDMRRLRDERVYRERVAAEQAARDAEYADRMAADDVPPTLDSADQAQRDATYAEHMEKDDVPPTIGSAPIPAAPEPPSAPKPGPALTERIHPAPSIGDHWTGGPALPADLDMHMRKFSAARRPEPDVTNVPLSSGQIRDYATLRQMAGVFVGGPIRPAPTFADAEPQAAPPEMMRETRAMRSSSGAGSFLIFMALAALASLPLFSSTARDNLLNLLAGLGFKFNALNFFALFKKRVPEPDREEPELPPAIVDNVDCSVYAPPAAPAGATVLIQVFLHVPDQAARVDKLATMMDTTTALKGVQTLSAKISRGTLVEVYLSEPDLSIEEPVQQFVWNGEPIFCQFRVKLPAHSAVARFYPTVRLNVGGGLVGRISFGIEALSGLAAHEAALNTIQTVPAGHSSQRYRKAFLSYATPDRREVLKRAQALEAAGVTFFQDILSLEPGARWERELYRHIDTSDLFLLFWSKDAAASPWVIKEAEYARARQNSGANLDFVPVILDGPPPYMPPDSLSDIHFNDRISYFIAAS